MDRLSTKGQMIDQIDLRGVPHSGFDRSNHNYGTGKLGVIIPTRLDEVYPGDRIKGRPQDVTNFEPLAAPLMGSMVLKQEAFFVPYNQLWRHAYKFFTGKNGFEGSMPAISPRSVFEIFELNVHRNIWSGIGTNNINSSFDVLIKHLHRYRTSSDPNKTYYGENGVSFLEDIKAMYDAIDFHLHAVYDRRKMYDLVVPCLDSLKRFIDTEGDSGAVYYDDLMDTLHTGVPVNEYVNDIVYSLAPILGNIIKDIFDFFHGPSSIFDYLGWPVPIKFDSPVKWDFRPSTEYGGGTISNIFQYVVYHNLNAYGSKTFFDDLSVEENVNISEYFSEVALVFNPFKAYYLIWYWNYRDQLLETDILDPEEDEFLNGTITSNIVLYCCMLRYRCWFKDTFTTALTNTGSGNMFVPTTGISDGVSYVFYDSAGQMINTTDQEAAFNAGATICRISSAGLDYEVPMNYLRGTLSVDSETQLRGQYISLDLFDRVRRLREYVQKRLILGYEVDDVVYSSFMVRMSNIRMHIPEILGQGRDAVQINTIVNNTSTDQQIAGDKTATAYVHGSMSEMNYFSEEWGLYLQFKTIMPIQSYAGGMQRLYLKTHPLDYMWPEFATMGMDAVYNCELSALGTRLTDEQGLQVFGYQGRYYDLKSRMDEEHGRLLTDLNYLTFSREWDKDNPPKLNYMFVHCHPRLDGFVVDSPLVDVFRYDCYNAQAWERRLPVPSEIVG